MASTRRQRVLIAAGLVLLAVLLYSSKDVLNDMYDTLKSVNVWLLPVLPLMLLCSHSFIALAYRSVLSNLGSRIKFSSLLPMVWALTFVNQVLPSGGASGLTYFIYGMRGKVSSGTTTLAHLARYGLSYLSYFVVLAVAFVFMIWAHKITTETLLFFGVLTLISIAGIIFFGYILHDRSRIAWFTEKLSRFVEWVIRVLKRQDSQESKGKLVNKVSSALEEFHKGYIKLMRHKQQLRLPFAFILASSFFENMIVYTSFLLVGADVNPGLIIVSFTLANFAGIISFVPGDVGVHEATMIAVLSVAGVPASTALSATLLYRVFNKLLFLPVGFAAYSYLIKPVAPIRQKPRAST